MPLVSLSEISSLYLAPVAAKVGLSLLWSQDRFSHDEAQIIVGYRYEDYISNKSSQ